MMYEFKGNYVIINLKNFLSFDIHKHLCYSVFDSKEGRPKLVCLYKVENNKLIIPRGLIPRIEKFLQINFKYINIDYNRVPKDVLEKLRDYQREVLFSLLKQIEKCGCATIWIATGGGKSFMIGAILRTLFELGIGHRAFVLAHTVDLVLQNARFIKYWGFTNEDIGVVTSFRKEFNKRIVCCTVQTLYKAIKHELKISENGYDKNNKLSDEDRDVLYYFDYVKLKPYEASELVKSYLNSDVVVIDECQHIPAMMYKTILSVNENSIRIGLSATPFRADGKDLEIYAISGDIIERKVTSSELIEKGYLVTVYIFMYMYKPRNLAEIAYIVRSVKSELKAYNIIKDFLFTQDYNRLAEIVRIAYVLPKPCLILTKEVAPAKLIYEALRTETDFKIALVTGVVKGNERERIFRATREGKIEILIATTLADEGIDIPELRSLLITCGGKSKVKALQRIGRVTRKVNGKEYAIVVDIWDQVYFLIKHGAERVNAYRTEKNYKVEFVRNLHELICKIETINKLYSSYVVEHY